MYGKNNMETYTTICKIEPMGICCMARETQTGCINLGVWDGEGVGRELEKGGDICIPMADSC